jgi:hypothetical protein
MASYSKSKSKYIPRDHNYEGQLSFERVAGSPESDEHFPLSKPENIDIRANGQPTKPPGHRNIF